MKESDLAKYFIDYFSEGYEIFKEVPASGIIDFIAKQGSITIAVEVKVSLNFGVIGQAEKNKQYCNYSYIAIPYTKREHYGFQICQKLGIGVLMADEFYTVMEYIKPQFNRNNRSNKWLLNNLKPYMKESIAGSQNDRITAFGNTVNLITRYVKSNPGCTLSDCIKNVSHHYASFSGAKNSIAKYIKNGIINTVTISNNQLYPK